MAYPVHTRLFILGRKNMLASRILAAVAIAAACFAQTTPQAQTPGTTYQEQIRETKSRIKEISAEELKALAARKGRYMLVDVREDAEWAAGHAAGAVHIRRGLLDKEIGAKAPRKNRRIVVYCQGGVRSALAADTLQRMGYSNVYSLAGGFMAYQKLGLPVEK
jgi:rhodanese-related sulfurtransferase